MSRRISKRLGYENLEQRRLLAADLAADILQCDMDTEPVEHCEVAMDFDQSATTDLSIDAVEQIANGDQLAPRVQELDLSDGSDGVFGTLDASNTSDSFTFQAENDGTVDVVVASSFGEADTSLEIRDSAGELVSATVTEGLDSFHTLRIEVDNGETYELTVSSEEGVEGNYQITVGFTPDVANESMETAELDDLATESEVDATDVDVDEMTLESQNETDIDCDHSMDSETEPTEVTTDETGASDDTVVETESESQTADESETISESESENLDSVEESENSGIVSENHSDTEPHLGGHSESIPIPSPEPTLQPAPESVVDIVDQHADAISSDSTELSLATGKATMLGQLENAGDVDTFRFTPQFDGSIEMFLADTTADSDLDLNIAVYDSNGQELLDGATNEIVKLEFKVTAGNEYFVSVSADQEQSGDYALIADLTLAPQPSDDHADAIGADATELVFSDGSWTATGELQFAEDTDAFRFTANCDETMTLAMDIVSENHSSEAQISVFGQDGELVVQGSTNDGVDLTFDTIEGVEYQILVDSTNDIAMSFDLTAKPIDTTENETQSTDDADESFADQAFGSCTDDIAGCGEVDTVDEFFSRVGEETSQFESMNTMSSELDEAMSSLLRFARRI